ncbi:MAG: RNA polymerase sigma factor (sigma-70 family) [Kiritimatiellia bacterium]|jgi:RNA polymerase sigma factor CnrH
MVQGARGLDRQAFSSQAAEHHRSILAYARSLSGDPDLARDLAQDAFLAAYQVRDRFDPTRSFGTWVRGILRHKWIDHVRRNRLTYVDEETLNEIDAQYATWDTLVESPSGGVIGSLKDCLEKLSSKQGEVVQIIYYEGSTSEEAAGKLDSSPAAVRKQLQRIREQLKDCLHHKTVQPGETNER